MGKYKFNTSIGYRRLVLRRMYHWLAGSPDDYLYRYLKFSQEPPIVATEGGHYHTTDKEYLKQGIRLPE